MRAPLSALLRPLRPVSIRTLALLIIAIVVLATAGLAYVTLIGERQRTEIDEVVQRETKLEQLYEDARASAVTEGATVAAYFSLRNSSYLADFERARADTESALSELQQVVAGQDAEEQARLDELTAKHEAVANDYETVLTQLSGGDEAAAVAIAAGADFQDGARELGVGLRTAADDAATRLLSAQRESKATQTKWSRVVLAGGAVWALFLIVTGYAIVRWGLRPIARVATASRMMGVGYLNVRVPSVGLRELDDLAASFNTMAASLEESTGQLRLAASTDGLTGLLNHGSLQDALTREIERSERSGQPVGVLMMDIDGFKLFNDTYGHQAGDGVLRQVAAVLTDVSRSSDVVGRYGGDEFMMILWDADRDQAVAAANRILDAFASERVSTGGGDDVPLALSIGLAVCPHDSRNKQELLAYADASLYEAKQVSGSSLKVSHQEPDELIAFQNTPMGVLDSLVRGIDAKDRYTRRHSQQDAELAVQLGEALGLSLEPLRALRIAGLLHDVGKIGVPDHILKKPAALTDEERKMMQEHVTLSKLIVQGVPNLQDVADAVYSHHERWDGTGYPRGLKGEEVPLLGRVLAIADAYSAMILDRPYRKALSHAEAVAELRRGGGTQFDPSLVEPFISLLESKQLAAA